MTQILIVEDDAYVRRRLEHILLGAGWSTVVAATGKQALGLFAQHKPRLAVVSIEMESGVGAETISRLRWQRRDAAVLAVTRRPVAPGLVMTARACGARQVLIGPVAAEELVAAVRAALEKPRQTAPQRPGARAGSGTAPRFPADAAGCCGPTE